MKIMAVSNLDKVDNDNPLSALRRQGLLYFATDIKIWIHKKYMKACSKVFENVLHNYTNKTEYICDCWVGSAFLVCHMLTKWLLRSGTFCGGCHSTWPHCVCRWWTIVPQWKWAVAWKLVPVTLELSVPRVSWAGKLYAMLRRTSVLG